MQQNVLSNNQTYLVQNGSGTEKGKKNTRKVNSGIPNKMLVGRSGQNMVQANHNVGSMND